VTEAENVEQATREGPLLQQNYQHQRQATVNHKAQEKRARKAASEFPVKDAVKSNDLADNKIDQLVQAPVIISPLMRML